MKLRKLQTEEHICTRALWEKIFTEDTPEFLDYYYSVKTQRNEIYVMEDEGKIVSMLHLNPYQMRIQDKIYQTHYIVAVATDEHYRKRGFMRQLLNYALQVMKDRGEPFTFLMPAAEAIYKPFGFEFVYEQRQGKLKGFPCIEKLVDFEHAGEETCDELADFANKMLEKHDIVTWRSAAYYRMILAEQKSEGGGILIAKRAGKIAGVFCYSKDKEIIFREPLCQELTILQQAIYHITGNETEEVTCIGYGNKTKPMIMAKVLNSEFYEEVKCGKVFINEVV